MENFLYSSELKNADFSLNMNLDYLALTKSKEFHYALLEKTYYSRLEEIVTAKASLSLNHYFPKDVYSDGIKLCFEINRFPENPLILVLLNQGSNPKLQPLLKKHFALTQSEKFNKMSGKTSVLPRFEKTVQAISPEYFIFEKANKDIKKKNQLIYLFNEFIIRDYLDHSESLMFRFSDERNKINKLFLLNDFVHFSNNGVPYCGKQGAGVNCSYQKFFENPCLDCVEYYDNYHSKIIAELTPDNSNIGNQLYTQRNLSKINSEGIVSLPELFNALKSTNLEISCIKQLTKALDTPDAQYKALEYIGKQTPELHSLIDRVLIKIGTQVKTKSNKRRRFERFKKRRDFQPEFSYVLASPSRKFAKYSDTEILAAQVWRSSLKLEPTKIFRDYTLKFLNNQQR